MKKNMKLATKVLIICGAMIVVFSFMVLNGLNSQRKEMFRAKDEATQRLTIAAAAIVESLVKQSRQGLMTEEQAREYAKESLRNVRFDNGDYMWINDTSPKMIMHPITTAKEQPGWYEDKGLSNYTTADGQLLFVEFARLAKSQGAGFVKYKWIKSGKTGDAASPKVSYIKYIPEWDWVIGTGTYVDDVEKQIGASLTGVFIFLIIVIAASVFAALFFVRGITKPIIETIKVISGGADQVSSASGQIASSSQELAQGASEQAASIEETASSLEEITTMISRNADNTRQASGMAAQANSVAGKGINAMKKMQVSIEEIRHASNETAKIIKTIDDIAFQTNLLALNAAVEAARAGDAGKGFAVVAEEVRNLSKRSAEAAKNTGEIIANSLKNVENGVKVTEEVRQILTEIGENIVKVNNLSGEVSAASDEQAKGIRQINTAVAEMDKVTQRNSANAEEAASASEELSSQSAELNSMVVTLASIIGENELVERLTAKDFGKAARMAGSVRTGSVAANVHEMLKGIKSGHELPAPPAAMLDAFRARRAGKAAQKAPVPALVPEDVIPLRDDKDLKEF